MAHPSMHTTYLYSHIWSLYRFHDRYHADVNIIIDIAHSLFSKVSLGFMHFTQSTTLLCFFKSIGFIDMDVGVASFF